jgi:Protein of unknown function (DUF2914)
MSEKKNIVIKVKYPTPGNTPTKTDAQPGVITEWNFKRIGLALGGLLLVLMSIFYFTGDNDPATAITDSTQSALPEQAHQAIPPQAEKPGNTSGSVKLDVSKVVSRAQLTRDIEKNEPVDNLKLPLKIGKKETLWIYYFIELKNMQGKTVFHEWWLNGNLVSRKKVNISDDPWRTASKQLITYTNNNDWVVRVVDESRNILTEKSFNLELK